MAGEGLLARGAAVALLDAVLGDGALLAQVLADADGPLKGLTASDRARAQRLALAVLRHVEQADRVLDVHLRKKPPLMARNVLRLAVVEIVVDGSAAHGVVNAAVNLVRHGNRTGHLTGLVNAVLRKVVDTPAPFTGMPAQRLPLWLRKPLVGVYGRDVVSAMEAVQGVAAPVDLTLKPGEVVDIPGAEVLPTGSLRITGSVQVSNLPGYAEGLWWVQDAAAALAVQLLGVQPGERAADLCAAPGGKALQMAAAGADVTAVDISEPRLARLRDERRRTYEVVQLLLSIPLPTGERRHVQAPKQQRRRYVNQPLDDAPRFAGQAFGLLDIAQDTAAVLKILLTKLGQRKRARSSGEQSGAESFF